VMRRYYQVVRSYHRVWWFEVFVSALALVTYFFISKTFAGAKVSGLQGAPSYFDYAVVGVAITTVVTVACASLGFSIREEQLTGTLEALTAQPVTAAELALGLAGYHFLFSVGRAAVYLSLAAALLGADFSHASWPGAAAGLVVTAVALTSIGVALGALVVLFKRVEAIGSVATFGLGLLGGAFFPISVLPGWLEAIARVVPTRLAFDGVRAALYRGEGWVDPLLGLAAFAAVSLPLALWLFGRALTLSRRRASLTQY
jgi:ABC-2 type transport system permease protein